VVLEFFVELAIEDALSEEGSQSKGNEPNQAIDGHSDVSLRRTVATVDGTRAASLGNRYESTIFPSVIKREPGLPRKAFQILDVSFWQPPLESTHSTP